MHMYTHIYISYDTCAYTYACLHIYTQRKHHYHWCFHALSIAESCDKVIVWKQEQSLDTFLEWAKCTFRINIIQNIITNTSMHHNNFTFLSPSCSLETYIHMLCGCISGIIFMNIGKFGKKIIEYIVRVKAFHWWNITSDWRLSCLLERLFRWRSNKTSKLRATALCEVTGGFLSQRVSNADNVSIQWRLCHEGRTRFCFSCITLCDGFRRVIFLCPLGLLHLYFR